MWAGGCLAWVLGRGRWAVRLRAWEEHPDLSCKAAILDQGAGHRRLGSREGARLRQPQRTAQPDEEGALAAGGSSPTDRALLQLLGTRPRRSTKRPRSRPCPSDSRLPYVPALLLSLVREEGPLVMVRILLE